MEPGARTPEELDTLFEDVFVTRDAEALGQLFEDGAVLAAGDHLPHARGRMEIAGLAKALWERDRTYFADPRRVVQSRESALVVAERGIHVVRRGSDGSWRYVISLLSLEQPTT
jgi:hypothetical protein